MPLLELGESLFFLPDVMIRVVSVQHGLHLVDLFADGVGLDRHHLRSIGLTRCFVEA